MQNNTLSIEKLYATISTLRSKTGCPWDRKQTPHTMKKYLQEEVAELIEAIDNEDHRNICEEIGDVVYILIMISQMEIERGGQGFTDSLEEINEKLIRRHPHVFGETIIDDDEQLRRQWQAIKEEEKKRNN